MTPSLPWPKQRLDAGHVPNMHWTKPNTCQLQEHEQNFWRFAQSCKSTFCPLRFLLGSIWNYVDLCKARINKECPTSEQVSTACLWFAITTDKEEWTTWFGQSPTCGKPAEFCFDEQWWTWMNNGLRPPWTSMDCIPRILRVGIKNLPPT